MTNHATSSLIEPEELAELLKSGATVKLLDATYATAEPVFPHARIDSAAYFDIDEICDHSNPLPHMLPAPDAFAEAVSKLGISNNDLVVVYDQSGIAMAASRVWWMFRVFGHENVRVLNGGLAYWHALGLPLNTNPPKPAEAGEFNASYRPELVRSLNTLHSELGNSDSCILDARSADRFSGRAHEPRPGMATGHMPGSRNTPFINLIDPATGRLKDRAALESAFAHVQNSGKIIATCGSGVTACVLALALFELGRKDVAVYDGSWSEWGNKEFAMPVEAD